MKRILKTAAAVIAAAVILDVFCAWFYNPAGYMESPDRATDLIREPGKFSSRAKEGIAWASMDEYGYNNANIPGDAGVRVLMMGSSHTEGLNVMQHETAAAQLDRLLCEEEKGMVYNMGMSSHTLPRNAANMERALKKFGGADYVVMETAHEILYPAQVYGAMTDNMERLDHTSGSLPGIIADRPLLKAIYRQLMSLAGMEEEGREELTYQEIDKSDIDLYRQALTELFSQLAETATEYDAQLIVYFHPHLTLTTDGMAHPAVNKQCVEAMGAACADAGVVFIDMTDRFMWEYETSHILPHGFDNTAAGVGHLNREGHRMIADELAKIIRKTEEAE